MSGFGSWRGYFAVAAFVVEVSEEDAKARLLRLSSPPLR